MVRKSRFLLCFLWFPEGPDPRSARAGAVETQFSPFDLASKTVLFLRHVGAYSWYRWRRNPVQKTFKIELESKICERPPKAMPFKRRLLKFEGKLGSAT